MKIVHLTSWNRNIGVTRLVYVAVIVTLLLSLLAVQPAARAQTGVLQLNPLAADITALVHQADTLTLQSQFEQAEAKYKEAVHAKPNDPLPYSRWSQVLLLDMKPAEAAAIARAAVTIEPASAEANMRLARAVDWQGRPEEALAPAQQALALDAANVEAHAVLAEIEVHLGRNAEALAEVTTALRLDPIHPEAHRSQALVLAAQGNSENAIQSALKAAQQQPLLWLRHHDLAEMLRGVRDYAQAISFYQSAIDLHPEGVTLAGVALCHIAQNQLSEATTALQTALQLDPFHPRTLGTAGLLHATAGQCEQAGPYIRLALQLDPRQTTANQAPVLCPNLGVTAAVSPLTAPGQPSLLVVPTTAPAATIAPTAAATVAAVAAACQNASSFVQDVTIPDYTRMQPGQQFDKIWRVRNSGTCPWGPGYVVAHAGGDLMNAPASEAAPSTRPGGTADVRVTMYAPAAPGTYQGVWQLRDPAGQAFGGQITVIVVVPDTASAPPATTAPLPDVPPPPALAGPGCTPAIDFRADRASIKPGESTTLRWDVECVREVYLGSEPVTGHASRTISPNVTRTYTLRIVRNDGGSEERQVTVSVGPDGTAVARREREPDVNVSFQSYNAGQGQVVLKVTNGPTSLVLESVDVRVIGVADSKPYYSGYSNAPLAPDTANVPFDSRLEAGKTAYLKAILNPLPAPGTDCRAKVTLFTGENRTGGSAVKMVDFKAGTAAAGNISFSIDFHSYDAASGAAVFRIRNAAAGVALESVNQSIMKKGTTQQYYSGCAPSPFAPSANPVPFNDRLEPGQSAYLKAILRPLPPRGTKIMALFNVYTNEGCSGNSNSASVEFTVP